VSSMGNSRNVKHSPARMFQSTMEACGFVVARKSDYYSPLPSRRRLKVDDGAVDEAPVRCLGVAYDLAGMKITLEDLVGRFITRKFMELLPLRGGACTRVWSRPIRDWMRRCCTR